MDGWFGVIEAENQTCSLLHVWPIRDHSLFAFDDDCVDVCTGRHPGAHLRIASDVSMKSISPFA